MLAFKIVLQEQLLGYFTAMGMVILAMQKEEQTACNTVVFSRLHVTLLCEWLLSPVSEMAHYDTDS